MERSRSNKRIYYYEPDYNDSENPGRNAKPRYNDNNNSNAHHFRRGGGGGARSGRLSDSPATVTTSYRILCHDIRAGSVIGKSGTIIKTIRQNTGAFINVHELIPGDEERIIEISDTRRRDPDGRMPAFSPAQEALLIIHDRILESDAGFGMGYGGNVDNGDEYVHRPGSNRLVTRLVVSRMHVGSLLGKGGKIIEQMRIETKTHIRVLPRDTTIPNCVSLSEEIVQVVGDINAVKNALFIISSRIRESQHRDRNLHGRVQSPDQFFPPDDELIPHPNSTPRRPSIDGASFGPRTGLASVHNNNFAPRPSGYTNDAGAHPVADNTQSPFVEGIVFQILCPIDKVDYVVGESNGIIELLRDEIGVDVQVADPQASSDERIIFIYSEEGPENDLFPAQEALLHIQTRIVDLVPDKENIITTRLLVPTNVIRCLEGIDGSLSDMRLKVRILPRVPREQLPPSMVSGTEEIVQITGEIKAARIAVLEVTSRLRSYIYRDKLLPPPLYISGPLESVSQMGTPNNLTPTREIDRISDNPTLIHQTVPAAAAVQPPKALPGTGNETPKSNEKNRMESMPSMPSVSNRITLVTRSILEVVLPEYAIPKLITRSKNKLAQISDLSGANVKLLEDGSETTEKIIQISGTPEQAERAQTLLQGFILSTQGDA